jgi:menaquinone-9 beta-reductase
MRVIARAELDAAIVTAAIDAGAEFRPECRAELLSAGSALLVTEDGEERVACGVFVSAEGLAGSSLARVGGFGWRVARTGLVGLGGTAPSCAPGQALDMYVGPGGYVGCVALASGERVVAAAVSPAAIREHGGPWPTCEAIIRGAGGPGEMLARLSVRGVPVLSRRRERVEGPGVLVLGDAAGYVEPITGEGMAWAVLGALEAEAHAVRMAMGGYAAGQWSRALGRLFGWRRARCRVLAGALRWGPTAALLGMVASWRPELCGPREGPPRRLAGA